MALPARACAPQVAVLNPPSNVVWSGVYALGGLAVKALASLDRALEGVRLLPALETPKPDPLTTDDNGRVRPDCFEVRGRQLAAARATRGLVHAFCLPLRGGLRRAPAQRHLRAARVVLSRCCCRRLPLLTWRSCAPSCCSSS